MRLPHGRLLFIALLTLAESPPARSQPPPERKQTARLDRYGDPLPEGAIARLGTVRFRDADGFHFLAYSPDGRFLITGGRSGVRVLDAATSKEVRRIGADLADSHGPVAISRDAKLVAFGGWSANRGGVVYDVATGRRISTFGRPREVGVPRFSPDGKVLAVYGNSPTIDLYDSATGARLRSLDGHRRTVYHVGFSRDGATLISAGDGTIRFWDVATGKEARRLVVPTGEVTKIALSPDGTLLASSGFIKERNGDLVYQNRVHLWDVASGKEVRQIVTPPIAKNLRRPAGLSVVTFTPDGKALLTGGMDGMLVAWDLATSKELRRFTDLGSLVMAIAFAPDGKTFAVADSANAFRVRELATGRDIFPTVGHRDMPEAIAFSPDGRMVATAGRDRTICLWDVTTGRELRRLVGHELAVRALKFSADGLTLFSAGYEKTLVWDPATGQKLRQLPGTQAMALALSPDGKTLAVVGDEMFLLIDAATGKELRRWEASALRGIAATFSQDGRTLFAQDRTNGLLRWDVATGKHEFRIQSGGQRLMGQPLMVHAAAFSPDRRFVALGGQFGAIPVEEVATGKEVCRFQTNSRDESIWALTFSPDGRTLAWSTNQGSVIRLGEVASGRERHRLVAHAGLVGSLAFSPDSKLLVSGCGDTTCLFWPLTGRLPSDKEQPAPLSETSLASSWEDLRSEDAARAYVALRRLTGEPVRSVPYFKQRLHPAAGLERRLAARLLADVDSDEFATREKATQELEELGELAESDLRKTLAEQPSAEVRGRIEQLLSRLNDRSPKRLRQWRAVEALEHIGTPEAQEGLKKLAAGAPEARLTQEAKAALDLLGRRSARK